MKKIPREKRGRKISGRVKINKENIQRRRRSEKVENISKGKSLNMDEKVLEGKIGRKVLVNF